MSNWRRIRHSVLRKLPLRERCMPGDRLVRKTPKPGNGIVHLGPGAFFRAFLAIYTEEAMAAQKGDWGIVAVSLQSTGPRDRLAPQGYAFTSVELLPETRRSRIVESITDCLVAPESPEAVLAAMADPATRIVSLTITEKGYCHLPASREIDVDRPDIAHDLANPGEPKSAPGFLVEALSRRREAGCGPFTVLSCDNLLANGALAKTIVLEFALRRDAELASWIETHVRFPGTMVDRITPATTEADIAALETEAGYRDEAMVVHEPFRQWVIEDDFVNGARPAWERAGAQLIGSVEAHELMKLRCLNASHSMLAYLGYLAGHEIVADAIAAPGFASLCRKTWTEEIIPTLPVPEGEDLDAYTTALLARFANPAIRHRTWQIAMDGSQKLPQRLLGTISDNLDNGKEAPGLCLGVAAWMRYIGGVDDFGNSIDVRDSLAGRLKSADNAFDLPEAKVEAFLQFGEIFPQRLAAEPSFRNEVTRWYELLAKKGAARTVADYTA